MTDHYDAQVRRQRDKAREELAEATAERDQFAAGVPLICCDERHEAKVRGLEALLVAGQQATVHWEGAYAREVRAHGATEQALRVVEARIAAVRALAADMRTWCSPHGIADHYADRIDATLDGPAEQPAGPPRLSPASIAAPEPVRPPALTAMFELAERARQELQAGQRHLEEAVYRRAVLAGLDVHWATCDVQEVAGHPDALARLAASPLYPPPVVQPAAADLLRPGLPLVPDETLPPGEIHLRPHPRPVDGQPMCCVCGTTEPGGRKFYENYQDRLFCWPCADGDRPTCPLGDACAGTACTQFAEHGPRTTAGGAP